ncbi:MAG: leucine-rich repeat protein [Bacteroidales bacterium]|nr:leucine-rich repeat protein [Bacteroidales bacterium]
MSERTHIERHKGGKIFIEGDVKTTEYNGAVYQLYDNDNTARLLYVKKIKNGLFGIGDAVLTIPSTVKSLFKSYTVVGCATACYTKGTEITTIQTDWKVDRRRKDGGYYTGSHTFEFEKEEDINTFEFIDKNKVKEVHFPETWRDEDIPSLSFFEHLEKVTIPNSVTKIDRYTFNGCVSLTTINIPDSVTSIGESAFKSCRGLTTINIPDSVTEIGEGAFYNCSGLTSVTIGKSVTKIEKNAFDNCKALTTINFNATNCSKMGNDYERVFDIESLKVINICENVTSIPRYAFYNCRGLSEITIPNSVTEIGYNAFEGCTGLTSVTIPNSVTSIGSSAFAGCCRLTSFKIPNSVTSININVFYKCTGLKSVTIPNSVTEICQGAFQGCGVTSINIPNSVTSIGKYAFKDCTNLTSVYYTGSIAQWCSVQNDGGDGAPLVYAHNLYIDDNLVTNLVIPETITEIKNYAFDGATCLTSVTIPNSVTSIGNSAFSRCSGLTEINIPDSVTKIGNGAFYRCSGLTSVTIPNSVTSIGIQAFIECTGLTEINIPDSVTEIGNAAFYGCTGLTSVTIPNSVTSIGRSAFWRCTGLTSVAIPNSVTSIDAYAFAGCSAMKEITIPSTVTKIGEEAFSDHYQNKSGLEVVNILNDEGAVLMCPNSFTDRVKINYLGKKLANKTENPVAKQEAKPADSDTTQAKEMPNAETPKAESKPAKTETKEETPKPAAKPATSDKVGLTVGSLTEAFKNQFGAVLRIYNGRSKADDGMSLQEVGLKQEINTTFDGKQTVGAFVEQMANAGLKVKVYTCDEWVAVLDGLTLEQAGKVKKSATKADMEKML